MEHLRESARIVTAYDWLVAGTLIFTAIALIVLAVME